jgi:hypothetical protein
MHVSLGVGILSLNTVTPWLNVHTHTENTDGSMHDGGTVLNVFCFQHEHTEKGRTPNQSTTGNGLQAGLWQAVDG